MTTLNLRNAIFLLPMILLASCGGGGDSARAWLHTNCAFCHSPGGPTPSALDFRYSTTLQDTNACEIAPGLGTLGLSDARLIKPGDAAASVVVERMSRRDQYGMPPIGSHFVDTDGVVLVSDWIDSLANCND